MNEMRETGVGANQKFSQFRCLSIFYVHVQLGEE